MTDTTDPGYCSDRERARTVVKLTQAALGAWMDYEPPEVRHISSALRHAFMSGYLAAAPQPMGEDAVERVARIIDPDAWHRKLPADGCGVYWSNRRASAKQKAQSIVAAMPQPASTVEAGDSLREAILIAQEALGRIASNGFGFTFRPLSRPRDNEMLSMMDCASKAHRAIDAALAKLDAAEKGGGE